MTLGLGQRRRLERIARFMEEGQAPGIKMETGKVKTRPASTGMLLGMGREREYAMVGNEGLEHY